MRSFDSSRNPFLTKIDFQRTASTRGHLPSTSDLKTNSIKQLLVTKSSGFGGMQTKSNYSRLPSLPQKRYPAQTSAFRVDHLGRKINELQTFSDSLGDNLVV